MVPVFKDEEAKAEYLAKMYGVLLGTEELVKKTRKRYKSV